MATAAPSLNNPVFHELVSDQLLTSAITDGRPDTLMAGFGGSLSAAAIEDLVHFIRSIAMPATAPDTSRAGVGEAWTTDEAIPVVHNPEGEAPAFAPANAYVPAAEVNLALQQGRRMVLLDARAPSDWRALHLPGALPAPFYGDPTAFRRVPNDGTQIVVYCGCPHVAADRVANALRALAATAPTHRGAEQQVGVTLLHLVIDKGAGDQLEFGQVENGDQGGRQHAGQLASGVGWVAEDPLEEGIVVTHRELLGPRRGLLPPRR